MKKFTRVMCLILALVCATMLFTGCKEEVPEVAPRVYAISGPTGVGMVHLMEDYDVQLASAADEVIGKIANSEVDIAALPTNAAAALYNKLNTEVTVLCVNTLGVLYMMDNTGTVTSMADLAGKTIYAMGEGANPEYILKYLLEKNNVEANIQFVASNDELTAKMVSGEAEIAMVPQPVATTVQSKTTFKIALNMTEEWTKVSPDDQLMMGCLVARDEYLDANPNTVEAFLNDYKASVESVNSDVAAAAALCETYKIIPKAAVAEKAIPYCNITFVTGEEMKNGLSGYLQVLYDANPKSVGGTLPGNDFYYGV
ncbi:MAG: ABC transporter substrate-binding protein [Clostridia bacterium]|nr:ABC transporter substrate-binding protein [Clostridia bacterium]